MRCLQQPSTIHLGITAWSLPNSGHHRSNTLAAGLLEEESSAFGIHYFVGSQEDKLQLQLRVFLVPAKLVNAPGGGNLFSYHLWRLVPQHGKRHHCLHYQKRGGVILAIKYLPFNQTS
jgi:hypothetical protein